VHSSRVCPWDSRGPVSANPNIIVMDLGNLMNTGSRRILEDSLNLEDTLNLEGPLQPQRPSKFPSKSGKMIPGQSPSKDPSPAPDWAKLGSTKTNLRKIGTTRTNLSEKNLEKFKLDS
jgi:hypothetical protein